MLCYGSNQYLAGRVYDFVWVYYVWEHPKAQPAEILVLNVTETWSWLKVSSDRLVDLGIKLRTCGY